MGLKVTTDGKPVTIYANEKQTQNGGKFTTYSIAVSSKDKDGNWVNGYIDAQFKKGAEVTNKTKININNAFYTVSEYNGKKYTKIFIMDYTVAEAGETPVVQNSGDFMSIPDGIDEELPFN